MIGYSSIIGLFGFLDRDQWVGDSQGRRNRDIDLDVFCIQAVAAALREDFRRPAAVTGPRDLAPLIQEAGRVRI